MKWFSLRLYKEALKQSRAVAIGLTVVSVLISSIVPAIYLVQDRKLNESVSFLGVNSLTTGLAYIAILFPVVLIVRLFGFLFKRSSSDFYHALPYTRQSIYFSNFLAVLTWSIAGLVVSIGLPSILYGINSHRYFKPFFILNNFAVGAVVTLFAAGAMLVAVSVMGRMMLSIELAAFIVCLPRAILLVSAAIVSDLTGVININHIPVLSPRYNLPFILIFGGVFDPMGVPYAYTSAACILTSLAIAVIYIALGCFLFCIRRSETAETAAPDRRVQAVIRTVYSLIFFFLAVGMAMIEEDGFSVAVFIVLGLAVYFLYELITTRKLKNMLKIIPGLGIIAIICVVYFFTVRFAADSVLGFTPDGEDIESVEMVSLEDDWSYYYGEPMDYNNMMCNNIRVSDSEINKLVADALMKTTEKVKQGDSSFYEYTPYEVRINTKDGKSKIRQIQFEDSEYAKFDELLMKQKEYHDATYAVPEDAIVVEFTVKEYNENIWKQFLSEYKALSDSEKDAVLSSPYSYYDTYYSDDGPDADVGKFISINISGYYKSQLYQKVYTVPARLMPKTFDLYNEYHYKMNIDKLNRAIDIFKSLGAGENDVESVGISIDGSTDEYQLMCDLDFYEYMFEDGLQYRLYSRCGNAYQTPEEDENMTGETATDGDAAPNIGGIASDSVAEPDGEDEYYDAYYENDRALNKEDADKLFDMMIGVLETDHKAESGKPTAEINFSYYNNDYYNHGSLVLNIDEEAFNELAALLAKEYR